MNKTKIEWCDYTINPVKGLCPMACEYCYARRMYKRFRWNPEIRFDKTVPIYGFPSGSRVFIGSTIELFGDWIKEDWLTNIFANVRENPDVTFIFLTKQPQNLIKWSPFPNNCWVGASVTHQEAFSENLYELSKVKAGRKFLSFEPLLQGMSGSPLSNLRLAGINWVVIGQQTPVRLATMPKLGWVEEIVTAAEKARIPVFLKDNLISCVDQYPFAFSGKYPDIKLRQEFPEGI